MFRLVCSLTALVCIILFFILVTMPEHYTALYGVAAETGGIFLGRRASPMFLGIALLLWMLRDQFDPVVQRAVCCSMIVIFGGIAMTGAWAFTTGIAGQAILMAALGELIIAAAFFWAMRRS